MATKKAGFEIFARLKAEDESMLVVYRYCHSVGVVLLTEAGITAMGLPKNDVDGLITGLMVAAGRITPEHTCEDRREMELSKVINIFKTQPLEDLRGNMQ